MDGKKLFRQILPWLRLFNLLAGLGFFCLGGYYLLAVYGLIDAWPVWTGYFVNDLLGMGMSTKSSRAVVWLMTFLGLSLIITSIAQLRE